MAWKQVQQLQSKGDGMARDHLQGSGKKWHPLTINTAKWLPIDLQIVHDIVYVT